MKHLTKRAQAALAGVMTMAVVTALSTPSSSAQDTATREFSLTITHVSCIEPCYEEGLESGFERFPHFYAVVYLNGVKQPKTGHVDDRSSVNPNWLISTEVPFTDDFIDVAIQIWDHDSTTEDEIGDVSGRDGDHNLDFRVPFADSRWFDPNHPDGDGVEWPNACSSGDGRANDAPSVKVCFELDVPADSDGDGLLDD